MLIDFAKFLAQLILALVLLRLVAVRTAETPVGEALAFIH